MARLGYTKIRALLTRPTCVLDQCRLLARSRFHSQCSGNDLLPGTSCALLKARRFDDCARRSLSSNPAWRLRHPGKGPGFGGRNQSTRDQGTRGGTSSGGCRFIFGYVCWGVPATAAPAAWSACAGRAGSTARIWPKARAESAGEVRRKRKASK